LYLVIRLYAALQECIQDMPD